MPDGLNSIDKFVLWMIGVSERRYILQKLLYILQKLRSHTGRTIKILKGGAGRTPKQHVAIYKQLEKEKKIHTKGNGLGSEDLIDVIPWGSRHLPTFETTNLRAVDIKCSSIYGFYSGEDIKNMILEIIDKKKYINVGIGVASKSAHVDIARAGDNAIWRYNY